MKYKLIFGLFGVSNNGVLRSPKGDFAIKLPKSFAFKLQAFLNKYICYVGLKGTKYLYSS